MPNVDGADKTKPLRSSNTAAHACKHLLARTSHTLEGQQRHGNVKLVFQNRNPSKRQHHDHARQADAHVEPPVDFLLRELLDDIQLDQEQEIVLRAEQERYSSAAPLTGKVDENLSARHARL